MQLQHMFQYKETNRWVGRLIKSYCTYDGREELWRGAASGHEGRTCNIFTEVETLEENGRLFFNRKNIGCNQQDISSSSDPINLAYYAVCVTE